MKNDHHEIFKNIGLILQLGLTVIVPVVLLTWLGVFLDKKYGIHLTVLFVLLGIAGGATGAWKLAHASIEKRQTEEEHYDLMKGYGLRSEKENEESTEAQEAAEAAGKKAEDIEEDLDQLL